MAVSRFLWYPIRAPPHRGDPAEKQKPKRRARNLNAKQKCLARGRVREAPKLFSFCHGDFWNP